MNVYFEVLGCRLNEAESEAWARDFHQRGFRVSSRPDTADVVVVNTCAVTREAMRKSRQLIRRSQRRNPRAKLVVSGCYATLANEETQGLMGVDLVVDNADKARLAEIATRELALYAMPALATEPSENPLFARGRSRAFVKVQDGCRYRCAFCIVTKARGSERSQTIGSIIDEINGLVASGIKEVVLTGVHLGGYGSDINATLHELIATVLRDTDVPRLRLGSLEPWDLPADFFTLFSNARLMPHLHLPLQSGSDTVLRRMGRRCKTDAYAQLATTARDAADINITTDVIVGFPGETSDEWRESCDYIERIGFSHIHIFAYSSHPGTRAGALPEQIRPQIKKRRTAELHGLAARMKRDFLQQHIGRRATVLWESRLADGIYSGHTANFVRVTSTGANLSLCNELTAAELIRIADNDEQLIARPGLRAA